MDRMRMLFESVATNGVTDADRIMEKIATSGLDRTDLRLRTTIERLAECGDRPIDFETFAELVGRFTFHIYDNLSGGHTGCKRDPRASKHDRKERDLSELRWAVAYGDRYATKVRDLMLDCMIDVCLADGEIKEDEITTISTTYAEIMGQPTSRQELERWIDSRRAKNDGRESPNEEQGEAAYSQLLAVLARERSSLDDNGREVILESAFRVACSDGSIEEEERVKLRAIARALGISEGVLELEIARFQRRLLQR